MATFAYSAAGLYDVGVSGGNRTEAFPRLAVSGAIVLLFASLGLLVFFADHLLHSIQVDAIMETGALLSQAARHGVCLRLRLRVGEHVVAGTTLAWIWRASPDDPAPDVRAFTQVLDTGVRIGFERTLEQDAAFGASEPTVANALLRLLGHCAAVAGDDPGQWTAIDEQARIIVSDAEREVAQAADLVFVHAKAEPVLQAVARHQPR